MHGSNIRKLALAPKNKSSRFEADFYLTRNCLTYPDDQKKDKLDKVLVDELLQTKKQIHDFQKKCAVTYQDILPEVIKFFNNFHGINETQKFWSRIIGQWLHLYVSSYLEKLYKLNKAFAVNSNLSVQSLSFEKFHIPETRAHFLNLVRHSNEFNIQLFSVILKNHFPEKNRYYEEIWGDREKMVSINKGSLITNWANKKHKEKFKG